MSRSPSIGAVALGVAIVAFAQAPAHTPTQPRDPGLYATIRTSLGAFTVRLFEQETPVTVRNFVDLALGRKRWPDPITGPMVMRPFYDGLTFHRVIKGFMIQGGDQLGNGNGATEVIPDELLPSLQFDVPGRLAMANSGPNTSSCQFFVTEVPTPHLNGYYTIFGQVVEGMDVVSKIAGVPTNPENDRPLMPVTIMAIRFQREGRAPLNDVMSAPAKQPTRAVR